MKIVGFGDMDFEDYGFWCGVPDKFPFATAVHTLIQRPGSTPVFGTPNIFERRIPVEIGWTGDTGPYTTLDEAWNGLMRNLRPTDPTPRELRGRTDQDVLVAMDAVVEIPAGIISETNVVPVTFITTDLQWIAISEATQTETLADPESEVLTLTPSMLSEEPGRIIIKPTVQRTAGTAGYGARYHRSLTLTNGYARPLSNEPVMLPLGDTAAWVTAGKALASGDDLRIVVDGIEWPRVLNDWNTASTGAWIIVPQLAPGESITFDILYGNPQQTLTKELVYPNLPPFDLDASDNATWTFRSTEDHNAVETSGLWALQRDGDSVVMDSSVPGSWTITATRSVAEDFTQDAFVAYDDAGTPYWRATMSARRSRAGAINPEENGNGDGVSLASARGITGITFGYDFRNDLEGAAGTLPVGQFVVLTRSGSQAWTTLASNNAASAGTWTPVASAPYTPSSPVNEIALSVWPYNGISMRAGIVTGRMIDVVVTSDIIVTFDDSGLDFGTLSAETEIYEFNEAVMTFEDGSVRVARIARIGYDTGGRLWVPLNNHLVIDALARTVEEWDSTLTTLIREVSPLSYSIRQLVSPDVQENTIELASDVWPQPFFTTTLVTNGNFAGTIDGWSLYDVTDGATGDIGFATLGGGEQTLRARFNASTHPEGAMVIAQHTATVPINGRYVVSVSADNRNSAASSVGILGIAFYTEADVLIEAVFEDAYDGAVDTWRRRAFGVEVPEGAAYWRPLLAAYANSAGVGGTANVYFDNVRLNDADLLLVHAEDDSPGTMELSYGAYPTFL